MGSRSELLTQVVVAAFAVMLPSGWPPSNGSMMLVPLGGSPTSALVDLVREGGATIVGTVPHTDLLLVRGERARLAPLLLRAGIVPVAAAASWCGA